MFVPILIANQFIPFREGYAYASVNYFLDKSANVISNFLISPWANFDGVYYLLIAENGYTVNPGFFPLFPILIHIASSIFGVSIEFDLLQYFTALFLSNVFFLFGLIMFYKLVTLDYKINLAIVSIVFCFNPPNQFFLRGNLSGKPLLPSCSFLFLFCKEKKLAFGFISWDASDCNKTCWNSYFSSSHL